MTLPIIKRYLISLSQYKWLGVVITVLSTSAAAFVGLKEPPPPKYTAMGYVSYTAPPVIISEAGTQITTQGQTLGEDQLLSPAIEQAVLKQVNLTSDQLKKNWGIYQATDNKTSIQVYYVDLDEELAKKTVDLMMAEMVNQSQIINSSRLRAIIAELEKRLPEITEDLKEAEQELEAYEKREGVSILAAKSGGLPAAITGNEQQQRQTLLQLEGINAQIQNIQQQLGLNADQAYIALSLAADPIIAQLRVQLYSIESQLQVQRKNFRDQHPNIVELLKQQQAAEEQLQQRASEVLGGNGVAAPLRNASAIRVDASLDPARQQLAQSLLSLETQKETLEQQLESLDQIGDELRQEFTTLPNKQQEYNRLAQQVMFRKGLYDTIQSKLVDAHAAIAETASSLTITQPAQASAEEVSPKSMILMLALGVMGGIGVSGGLIFVLGILNTKYFSWQEIQAALQERDISLLGRLPDIFVLHPSSEPMPLLLAPNSPYLEFYERLRSKLMCLGKKPPQVILLTSAMADEGKTFCAYNLAITAARAGKRSLLIEADLRCRSQVQSLNMKAPHLPVAEPLRYYGDLSECVRLVPGVENLSVIASPGPVSNAGSILESSEMQRLLSDVRHRYDWVILDAPAITANNDVFMLASGYIDGVILVARPYYTTSGMLTEVLDQLTESDEEEEETKPFPLLGVIINGVDDLSVELPEALDEFEGWQSLPMLSATNTETNGKGNYTPELTPPAPKTKVSSRVDR